MTASTERPCNFCNYCSRSSTLDWHRTWPLASSSADSATFDFSILSRHRRAIYCSLPTSPYSCCGPWAFWIDGNGRSSFFTLEWLLSAARSFSSRNCASNQIGLHCLPFSLLACTVPWVYLPHRSELNMCADQKVHSGRNTSDLNSSGSFSLTSAWHSYLSTLYERTRTSKWSANDIQSTSKIIPRNSKKKTRWIFHIIFLSNKEALWLNKLRHHSSWNAHQVESTGRIVTHWLDTLSSRQGESLQKACWLVPMPHSCYDWQCKHKCFSSLWSSQFWRQTAVLKCVRR